MKKIYLIDTAFTWTSPFQKRKKKKKREKYIKMPTGEEGYYPAHPSPLLHCPQPAQGRSGGLGCQDWDGKV